eukprot:scaffold36825_cov62-Phaeocystis_antarctica.AAC.3
MQTPAPLRNHSYNKHLNTVISHLNFARKRRDTLAGRRALPVLLTTHSRQHPAPPNSTVRLLPVPV